MDAVLPGVFFIESVSKTRNSINFKCQMMFKANLRETLRHKMNKFIEISPD